MKNGEIGNFSKGEVTVTFLNEILKNRLILIEFYYQFIILGLIKLNKAKKKFKIIIKC